MPEFLFDHGFGLGSHPDAEVPDGWDSVGTSTEEDLEELFDEDLEEVPPFEPEMDDLPLGETTIVYPYEVEVDSYLHPMDYSGFTDVSFD